MDALVAAERIELREFEGAIRDGVRAGMDRFFEGCLPVEIIAERGRQALAFGPLRPVGLRDPRTGKRPHAVVQLRQDNAAGSLYNLVGFQTNLREEAQRRVLRMIPGLAGARFARYGQMHRNTFVNAPRLLRPTLQFRGREDLLLAGQLTGVEGYLGNIATGLLAGLNAARLAQGSRPIVLPPTTMLGALCRYVTEAEPKTFQPMKANLGLLEPLAVRPRGRPERGKAYADRSAEQSKGCARRSVPTMRIATHHVPFHPNHTLPGKQQATRIGVGLVAAVLALAGAGCARVAATEFDGEAALLLAGQQMSFGPRIPGTAAHSEAEEWILGTLEAHGWETSVHTAVYRGVELHNLVGKRGTSEDGPILIGAHYDTRPQADRDPVDPEQPVPGANDGASGVAVLLELARVLPSDLDGREVWLAFFDGEDSGGLDGWEWSAGAAAFAADLTVTPQAVVILDMVGDVDLQIPP